MKELLIEPQTQFAEKVRVVLEVDVSTKNLISEEKYDGLISEIFSTFDSAKTSIHVFVSPCGQDRIKVKLEVRSAEENESLLGAIELFLHNLGNVRVYHKKIEYRLSR